MPFCFAPGTRSSRPRQREETTLPQAGEERYCMGLVRRFHCRCPSQGVTTDQLLGGGGAVLCPSSSDLLYCWDLMTRAHHGSPASMNSLHVSLTKMNTAAFLVSLCLLLGLHKASGKTSSLSGAVLRQGNEQPSSPEERVGGDLATSVNVGRGAKPS